eukprot:6469173-Amphidinium_carterae.1
MAQCGMYSRVPYCLGLISPNNLGNITTQFLSLRSSDLTLLNSDRVARAATEVARRARSGTCNLCASGGLP